MFVSPFSTKKSFITALKYCFRCLIRYFLVKMKHFSLRNTFRNKITFLFFNKIVRTHVQLFFCLDKQNNVPVAMLKKI